MNPLAFAICTVEVRCVQFPKGPEVLLGSLNLLLLPLMFVDCLVELYEFLTSDNRLVGQDVSLVL